MLSVSSFVKHVMSVHVHMCCRLAQLLQIGGFLTGMTVRIYDFL